MRLEKMDAFFEARLDGYEAHMLTNIAGAEEFYAFTAEQLPKDAGAAVLDLGCGTGLELRWYYAANPKAKVTGIDLSAGMLAALRRHYEAYAPTRICGDYFSAPFGEAVFDAAVSVESLHHFTQAEKMRLYAKLHKSLRPGGYFILTDYFALSDDEETAHRQSLLALKAEQNLSNDAHYHYDTPLTVEHERQALLESGFRTVTVLQSWGATYTLRAEV